MLDELSLLHLLLETKIVMYLIYKQPYNVATDQSESSIPKCHVLIDGCKYLFDFVSSLSIARLFVDPVCVIILSRSNLQDSDQAKRSCVRRTNKLQHSKSRSSYGNSGSVAQCSCEEPSTTSGNNPSYTGPKVFV